MESEAGCAIWLLEQPLFDDEPVLICKTQPFRLWDGRKLVVSTLPWPCSVGDEPCPEPCHGVSRLARLLPDSLVEAPRLDEPGDLLPRVLVVVLLMALVERYQLLGAVDHGLDIDVAVG